VTRTYAILDVSPATYEEIRAALETAAYGHAFSESGVIDMSGIALRQGAPALGKARTQLVFRRGAAKVEDSGRE